MLVETCNPVVDATPPLLCRSLVWANKLMGATPPLVDVDVEQGALDGDQPGVGELVDGRHSSSSRC